MTESDLLTTLPESQRTLFLQAYEQARADGLCHDGALELAYERLKNGESGKKTGYPHHPNRAASTTSHIICSRAVVSTNERNDLEHPSPSVSYSLRQAE